jgi:fructokinase
MKGRGSMDVLVIGESLMDIVETATGTSEHVGGSPSNVALGLGRLGVSVALLTELADDARGRAIVDHLKASRVDVLPESMSATRTSTAVARIGPDGQATYEFDLAWNAREAPAGVRPRIVHTGSVAAFLEPGASTVREILDRTGAMETTFDPNIRPSLIGGRDVALPVFEAVARLSRVVKLSDQDAEWLYPGASADEVIKAILALGPRMVAVTLGADGAIVATATDHVRIPAVHVLAVDTIGAGDTFMASLIHSILETGSRGLDRESLSRIGHHAVHAAAITVSRSGADLPWEHEV